VGDLVNRYRRRIERSVVLGSIVLGFTVLAAVVPACSFEQRHGYVQSADQSLSFRHPVGWQPVDLDPISSEWVVGIDASSQPSEANLSEFLLESPFVVAQVYPLEETTRDTVTLESLRLLALADRRDPLAGDDPSIRLVFHEAFVDEHGFEGHHMRFEVDLEAGTAVEEQLAVFDPQRYRIQRVRVACSISCFDAHVADIDALFESVRLQP
jgi:hypothetical protein